jgi:hypothetical protein
LPRLRLEARALRAAAARDDSVRHGHATGRGAGGARPAPIDSPALKRGQKTTWRTHS